MELLTIVGITFAWFFPRALAVFAVYIIGVVLYFKFRPKKKEKKEIRLDDDEELDTEKRIAKLNALEANAYDNIDSITVDSGYLHGRKSEDNRVSDHDSLEDRNDREFESGVEEEREEYEDLPENKETTQTAEVSEMEANYAIVADEDCLKTEPVTSGVFDNVEGFVTENEEKDASDLGKVPNVSAKLIDLVENDTDNPQNESNFDDGFGSIGETLKLYQKEARQMMREMEDSLSEQEYIDEEMAEETPDQPEPEE